MCRKALLVKRRPLPYFKSMEDLKREIIQAALPNVIFDGWTMHTLRQAAESLGKPALEADRAFPGGIMDALNFWTYDANRQLEKTLTANQDMATMKIRDRIAFAVMTKLRQNQPHKEAVRRALAIYNMPWHAADGLKSLYDTCDTIWRAAGDTSTDWNFYSKRALLAKVYMTTLYVWLDDESDDLAATEAFLHRRIEDVMQIQKAKFKLKGWVDSFSMPGVFKKT